MVTDVYRDAADPIEGYRQGDDARLALLDGRASPVEDDLTVQLLHGFRVSVGRRQVDDTAWYLQKARSLIKLLALAPGHRLHREQVMDLLWPDLSLAAAANNLHKCLHVTRRILEPGLTAKSPSRFLHLHGDLVVLDAPGGLRIDVSEFEMAAVEARRLRSRRLYALALNLYTGDLLPEDRYNEWFLAERERLRALYHAVLLEASLCEENHGSPERAIELLQRLVDDDPAHERARYELMRLLGASGQRHQALRHYQQLRAALSEELETEPERDTQILYQRLLAGAGGEALAVTPVQAPRTQRAATSSVPENLAGREREVRALWARVDALQEGRGAIGVITGADGMGKTALAAAVTEYALRADVVSVWQPASPPDAGLHARGQSHCPPIAAPADTTVREVGGALVRSTGRVPHLESAAMTDLSPAGISRLAALASVMVVVDGVDPARRGDGDLVRAIGSLAANLPVLLLATLEAGSTRGLGLVGDVETVALRPLTLPETRRVVERRLGGPIRLDVAQLVQDRTHGNPYYVHEVTEALWGRNALAQIDGTWCLTERSSAIARALRVRRPRVRQKDHTRAIG